MRSPCLPKVRPVSSELQFTEVNLCRIRFVWYDDSRCEARGISEGPRAPLFERGRGDEGSHMHLLLDLYPSPHVLCALIRWASVSSAVK